MQEAKASELIIKLQIVEKKAEQRQLDLMKAITDQAAVIKDMQEAKLAAELKAITDQAAVLKDM